MDVTHGSGVRHEETVQSGVAPMTLHTLNDDFIESHMIVRMGGRYSRVPAVAPVPLSGMLTTTTNPKG